MKKGYRLVVTLANLKELNFLEESIKKVRTQAYMSYRYNIQAEEAIFAKLYKANYNDKRITKR